MSRRIPIVFYKKEDCRQAEIRLGVVVPQEMAELPLREMAGIAYRKVVLDGLAEPEETSPERIINLTLRGYSRIRRAENAARH